MNIVLIGAGQRGMIYGNYLLDLGVRITAVVEPDKTRRENAAARFGVRHVFASIPDFLESKIKADAAIIATMDQDHFAHAMALLDAGCHLLLEKPISPSSEECMLIDRKAAEMGLEVIVCHVLRYTNFFSEIKRIASSGELGKIVTIEYAEFTGNYHMAHSFVRGKWKSSRKTSPIILQKSCHDMDILTWLTGSPAKKISSFGHLTYFKEENAPEGSTERCSDCPLSIREKCKFDAEKVYIPMIGKWRCVDVTDDPTEEGMRKAIKEGPYGQCVFRCGNDVCDHQVTAIEFENGVTATFTMSGFSNLIHRRITVMCEQGSIIGDDVDNFITKIPYQSFGDIEKDVAVKIPLPDYIGRHGGGDYGIVKEFLRMLETFKIKEQQSTLSINSHDLNSSISTNEPDQNSSSPANEPDQNSPCQENRPDQDSPCQENRPDQNSSISVNEPEQNSFSPANDYDRLSEISKSIESHLMANAAELSRITGRTVDMNEYRKAVKKNI